MKEGNTIKVPSKLFDVEVSVHGFKVTWRDTMNYAAAVGDENPYYLDDERIGGIIAHPMFSVVVTWGKSQALERYYDTLPKEIISTRIHYTEHLEFYRPIVPGDELITKGRVVAVLPHKGNTYIVSRLDVFDKTGKPVFIEHIGGILWGIELTDEGIVKEVLPEVPRYTGNNVPIWESVIRIEPLAPFIYDGCTGIVYPIHTSVKFAHQLGLPGRVLHGTATLAYAVRELINREAGGNPLTLKSLYSKFSSMVLPGTYIKVQLLKRDDKGGGTDLFFVVLNAEGKKAISDGYARLEKHKEV